MEREYEEKKKRAEEKKSQEVERFMSEMNGGLGVKKEEDGFEQDNDQDNVDDGIPFACHLCRGPFKDPIVTTCNHYFCESCMSKRVREVGMGCPICQKDTHGVLNFPQKLVAKKRRLIGRDGTWEDFFAKNRSS
jgi:RING finger protein 113A